MGSFSKKVEVSKRARKDRFQSSKLWQLTAPHDRGCSLYAGGGWLFLAALHPSIDETKYIFTIEVPSHPNFLIQYLVLASSTYFLLPNSSEPAPLRPPGSFDVSEFAVLYFTLTSPQLSVFSNHLYLGLFVVGVKYVAL
jgi:hypothetical protein